MGSFRLAAGRRYLHRHFNFTESAVETVVQSLRRSCASELTRQGTSLILVTTKSRRTRRRNRPASIHFHRLPSLFANRAFPPVSARRHADRTLSSPVLETGAWRIVSEDSKDISPLDTLNTKFISMNHSIELIDFVSFVSSW
jgi:hypothetical protein